VSIIRTYYNCIVSIDRITKELSVEARVDLIVNSAPDTLRASISVSEVLVSVYRVMFSPCDNAQESTAHGMQRRYGTRAEGGAWDTMAKTPPFASKTRKTSPHIFRNDS